jgi:hypothetical protein
LNMVSPAKSTLIADVVHGTPTVLEGIEVDVNDGKPMSDLDHPKALKEARSTECCV